MWPLNMRFFPPPLPSQRPTTFARLSSTSCHVTCKPICSSALRIYCAIGSSSPVGLGMLITSHAIATISSSFTSARTFLTSFASRLELRSFFNVGKPLPSLFRCSMVVGQAKIVWIGAKLFVAAAGDVEVVFQAQAAAAGPVDSGLDSQHHAFFHRTRARLVRVRGLMRPRSNPMTDGMGGLSGIAAFRNTSSDQAVQLRETGAIPREHYRLVEHLQ